LRGNLLIDEASQLIYTQKKSLMEALQTVVTLEKISLTILFLFSLLAITTNIVLLARRKERSEERIIQAFELVILSQVMVFLLFFCMILFLIFEKKHGIQVIVLVFCIILFYIPNHSFFKTRKQAYQKAKRIQRMREHLPEILDVED
jgi:ABC-type xylose transport system permease subunit